MALRKNVVAGYLSQAYISLVGVVMLPLYLKYMGNEAFGLVGFFAMLQALFGLLDIGLTPTVSRESARFNAGAMTHLDYRRLLRALEYIFLSIAFIGGVLLFSASELLASRWLKIEQLSITEVGAAIQLMAISVGLRWMSGFYRGVISGSERLVLLSSFNSAIATARFVFVLPFLIFVSATPSFFFGFQLAVALLELTALVWLVYRMLPTLPPGQSIQWKWAPLKPVLKFSLTIAFTSSVWVLVTQTDKLVLSKILLLAEYGSYTLAVMVASSIMMLSSPISAAIMPRMVKLEAEGNHADLIRLYRQSTQLVAVLAGAAAVTAAFFAEPLLWAWTGDHDVARQAAPVLALYALGNGVLSVAAFPYYLQYAKGDLRMHLIGNTVFVVILIPTTIWGANYLGGVGAGYVWLGVNLITFVFWLPFVHNKFTPGLNAKWYFQDLFPIIATIMLVGYAMMKIVGESDNRILQFIRVTAIGFIILAAGCAASSVIRTKMQLFYKSTKFGRLQ